MDFEKIWNEMTPTERKRLVHRDTSMRDPAWKPMVTRLVDSLFADLTALQRGMVESLLKKWWS